MSLHVKQILDDTKQYTVNVLPACIDTVLGEFGGAVPLPVPAPENYHLHQPSQFQVYQFPAVFLFADSTKRQGTWTSQESNYFLNQTHYVYLTIAIEESDPDRLATACYGYAQALDAALQDADITDVARTWSSDVKIPDIDYGVMFSPKGERRFRAEVTLTLQIIHRDRLTPRG